MNNLKAVLLIFSFLFIFTSCVNDLNCEAKEQEEKESDNLTFIYDYLQILSEEYPPPFGVREDLVEIYNDFDFNNDGINDCITAYQIYMNFILVIFDGKTHEILFETTVMMLFLPELTKMEIYLNEQREVLFWFSKRYQDAEASSVKTEKIQIVKKESCKIFEAVYNLDDKFIHAYEEYDTEDEYISTYMECLEGYEYFNDINLKIINEEGEGGSSTVFIEPNTISTTDITIQDELNKSQLNNLENLYNYFYSKDFGKSNFMGRISFVDLKVSGNTAVIFHLVEKAGMMGTDYMYALDGSDNLIATWYTRSGENNLFIDDDNNLHIISLYKFFASANNQFTAYQNISFNNNIIKYEIPFIINVNVWFEDDGEHRFAWNIYGD